MSRFRFRPAQRIKRPSDFRRVYDRRSSVSDAVLIVYGLENGLAFSRLGCSVGRKLGGAVTRNLLKRRLREAFRLTQHELPAGLDFVAIPRDATTLTRDAALKSLPALARAVHRKLLRGTRP